MLEKILDTFVLLIAAIQDHATALRDHSAALRGGATTQVTTATTEAAAPAAPEAPQKAARGNKKEKAAAPEAPAPNAAPAPEVPASPASTAASVPPPNAQAPAPTVTITAQDLNNQLVAHMKRIGKGRAPIDGVLSDMGVKGLNDPKLAPSMYGELLKRVEALQP